MYAIIKTGGKQYKVSEGDLVRVEKLPYEVGETVEFDEQTLNEIEERLDLISRLKRKYGNSIEEILAYLKKAESELNDIKLIDERTN